MGTSLDMIRGRSQWMLIRGLLYMKALGNTSKPQPEPASRLEEPAWRERWERKRAEPLPEGAQLVFLGDSITQNYELDGPQEWARFAPVWRTYYEPRGAVNLGYAGDATWNLLWRLRHGELDGLAPRVFVLLIGVNDLVIHASPAEQVVRGIDAVIDELTSRSPGSRILLLGLLPNEFSGWATRQTAAVNQALSRPDRARPGVTYLDAGGALMTDGRLDEALYCDKSLVPPVPILLHPSASGMARVAAAIEPAVVSLLGCSVDR